MEPIGNQTTYSEPLIYDKAGNSIESTNEKLDRLENEVRKLNQKVSTYTRAENYKFFFKCTALIVGGVLIYTFSDKIRSTFDSGVDDFHHVSDEIGEIKDILAEGLNVFKNISAEVTEIGKKILSKIP